jgi:hypothetical protein|tara:strand:+ start:988 stop:1128 length:141 start_codon:yes stop_codon:yes gene_type:complete
MIRFHALLYLSIYLAGSVLILTYRAYTTYRCGDAGSDVEQGGRGEA